jgi:hypothetical protein
MLASLRRLFMGLQKRPDFLNGYDVEVTLMGPDGEQDRCHGRLSSPSG